MWRKFGAEKLGMSFTNWAEEDIESIRKRWCERNHDRYFFLRDKITRLRPDSVLEIGSSCGNILVLLSQTMPNAKMTGIDLNPVAVESGNRWLKEEQVYNVTLEAGSAEGLSRFSDKSFDVVFSSAALMYVKPRDIERVMINMVRISKKAVILLEMHSDGIKKYLGEFYSPNNWKRDYRRILSEMGISNDRILTETVPAKLWLPTGGGATYIEVRTGSCL
jgi:ubiquinone/menaquinone biosynthesis C-methylase UbiE